MQVVRIHRTEGIFDMKKIISILLALAVVFSFAACENGVVFPENAEKTVLSVTLESAPEYLVGETVDPADVTLRVVYGDRTEDTFTGAELGLTATSYKLTDVKNTFTVKFGAPVEGTIKPWSINIPAYKLDKLVVDPTEAVKTVAKDAQTISTTGLAFTGTYNGNQTKSVSYDVAKESFKNLAFTVDTSVEKEEIASWQRSECKCQDSFVLLAESFCFLPLLYCQISL